MIDYTANPDADYYYGHDHLFSVCVLFDDSGAITEHTEYDAYGYARTGTGWGVDETWFTADDTVADGGDSNVGNPYFFTGRRLDLLDAGALPLMYYRAPMYDPVTGRFLQRDPLAYLDGPNAYEYVVGRPVCAADPLGLSWVDPITVETVSWEPKLRRVFWRRYKVPLQLPYIGILPDPWTRQPLLWRWETEYRWVNYKVDAQVRYHIEITGPTTFPTPAPWPKPETAEIIIPVRQWIWPSYASVVEGLMDLHTDTWNPRGIRYRCRAFFTCEAECTWCSMRRRWFSKWEVQKEGYLAWDSLGGQPYCEVGQCDSDHLCPDALQQCWTSAFLPSR